MRVCAVCGRVLDFYDGEDTRSWLHSLQDRVPEDHPAVPVPLSDTEMIGRCDFCNVDFPRWVVPARSFEVLPGAMSNGDWAACDTCCEMISNRRWESIIRRAADHSAYREVMSQAAVRASLATLYSRLKRNITGEPYPITAYKI